MELVDIQSNLFGGVLDLYDEFITLCLVLGSHKVGLPDEIWGHISYFYKFGAGPSHLH